MSRAQIQRNPFLLPISQWGPFSPPTAFSVLEHDATANSSPRLLILSDASTLAAKGTVLLHDGTVYGAK